MNVTAIMVFFMLIGLIGYFLLGYLFGRYHRAQEEKKEGTEVVKKQAAPSHTAGVIEYPSQEDIDYTESGEEKVDQAREELFRKYFTN